MSSHFQDCFWVGNGFDDLKAHMKTGTDFCKDLEALLSDRAELEKEYANGIHKILKKVRKSTKRTLGSIEEAWSQVIASLEAEEECHRTLQASLSQEGSKVMKAFTDTQIKTREPAVAAVEKQYKHYMDKYRSQLKNKRSAYKNCRDLEASWEQLKDMKAGKSAKPVTDKEVSKMEKACRKLEESKVKSDREYRDSNMKTEESRLGWESAMYKCCNTLETLEYERIHQVQGMLNKYCELIQTIIAPIESGTQEVLSRADQITPDGDIEMTCTNLGTGPNQPEQLLLNYYEEDFSNNMDSERRRKSLEKKIQFMEEEIDRQQRAKGGVEQLAKVYQEQPDFTDEKGAEDVNRQLIEADCMLNMLKANHFKLLCSHAEISQAPRPSSHFGDYINASTDKHNQPLSILKIPLDQISDVQMNYEPPSLPRGAKSMKRGSTMPASFNGAEDSGEDYVEMNKASGASLDFGEFDDQPPADDFDNGYVGQCRVLYDYEQTQDDELTVVPGDVINIVDKYDQEWWQGELNGKIGVFPSSYVEEL